MKELHSPLKKHDYDQIDIFFDINKLKFLKIDLENLNIKKFKIQFSDLNEYLNNLNDREKNLVWLYLYSKVMKYIRENKPLPVKNKGISFDLASKVIFVTIMAVVVLIVFWGIYSLLNREKSPEQKARDAEILMIAKAQVAVSTVLKDANTAQFRNQSGICGEVNAKNSFGGYSGYTRYIAANSDLIALETKEDSHKFEELWNKMCR